MCGRHSPERKRLIGAYKSCGIKRGMQGSLGNATCLGLMNDVQRCPIRSRVPSTSVEGDVYISIYF